MGELNAFQLVRDHQLHVLNLRRVQDAAANTEAGDYRMMKQYLQNAAEEFTAEECSSCHSRLVDTAGII